MANQRKRDCYILFIAFVLAIVIFGVPVQRVAAMPHAFRPPDPATMRPIVYGFAGVALMIAISISVLKMPRAINIDRFRLAMILALAFTQTCCIFGLLLFFLGAPPGEFIRFQAAAIGVQLVFILPRIIRYTG